MQDSYSTSFVFNKRKTIIIVLSFLLTFLSFFGLEEIGINIAAGRELFGFISLAFIPGALIMVMLKPGNIKKTEGLLYAVGISLFFIMALGLFTNIVYPLIGIKNPISEKSLIATVSGVIFLLIILFNLQIKGFHYSLNIKSLFSPITLSLLLIPFLSILGAYLVNQYSDNTLLLILIPFLALFPLFVLHDKFPEELYPLAVFIIGISLMYHISLIGTYAIGDIQTELQLANIVKNNSYWDYTSLYHPKSNLLSLMIMIPAFSNVLGMSFNWIYKIILPFFSSLVPVGIYLIAQKQTNSKIAFLSAFFFMSLHFFFMGLLTIRFRISELFMILLILLMLSSIEKRKSATLLVFFIPSLIWSYYGVTYSFLVIIIISTLTLLIIRRVLRVDFEISEKFSFNFLSLFLVVLLAWYIYTADSTTFKVLVDMGNNMIRSLNQMFTPVDQGPIDYATRQLPFFWKIYRWLNYVTQFFIVVGGVWMLVNRLRKKSKWKFRFNDTYILFSITSFIMVFIWIIHTPTKGGVTTGSFGFTRLYSLLLIFLAPLCIIGGLKITEYGKRFARLASGKVNIKNKNLLYPLAIFFMIFLLFSSNFVMEVGGGLSDSQALSKDRVMKRENIQNKLALANNLIYNQDVYAGKWLSRSHKTPSVVHTKKSWIFQTYIHPENLSIKGFLPPRDIVHIAPFGEGGKMYLAKKKDLNSFELKDDAYIFLSKFNTEQGLMGGRALWWETKHLYPIIEERKKIYTNGGSIIYK